MAAPQAYQLSLRRANNLIAKQHIKSFSSTSRQCKRGRGAGNQLGNQSLATRMFQMKGNEVPDDLGLTPGMLIKPLSKKTLPPFLSRKRLQLEFRVFMQSVLSFYSMWHAKRWAQVIDPETGKKVKEPLAMKERYELARTLHQQLYSAIAERNEKVIEEIACTGVRRQAQVRIANQKHVNAPKEHLSIKYRGADLQMLPWILQNCIPPQLRSTQIILDRYGPIGAGDPSNTVRQVVVRLKSTQTLSKEDGSPQQTFHKDEMVVIQTQKINGEQLPWKFWGTIEGSTPQEIDQILLQSKEGGFVSKLKEYIAGNQASTGGAGLP